ncbi:hypothetical protein P154DRAFT_603964 [Amniculicola lignicola CBS 123094]|uniref:DUF7702 domain-containing protein n=1 Tax=Amniculicola lignicola CBS 123094 TaxID=1392246 RepID=A0A6A5X2S7_9PLEO|nr:hypothetical protein P154DRAFT_603964 [Amniculicola lignicola CBS 123094]
MQARDWVSIVEPIFYIPTLVVAIITCFRHGFHRSSGWIYTLILCIVRIAGAVCQLLEHTDHSSGLIKATIIIDSIGLSPLLLATLGMLSRFVDFINTRSTPIFGVKHFRILQLLITLGLILSVAGGSSGTTSPDGTIKISSTSKVGVVLYIVAYVGLGAVYFISASRTGLIPEKERRVPVAVLFALPLICVRLIYSACSVFIHDHLFNIINGSVVVLFVMAVLEEFIVVLIYLALGFAVDKLDPAEQGPIAGRAWKNKKNKRSAHLKSDAIYIKSQEDAAMPKQVRSDVPSTVNPMSASIEYPPLYI